MYVMFIKCIYFSSYSSLVVNKKFRNENKNCFSSKYYKLHRDVNLLHACTLLMKWCTHRTCIWPFTDRYNVIFIIVDNCFYQTIRWRYTTEFSKHELFVRNLHTVCILKWENEKTSNRKIEIATIWQTHIPQQVIFYKFWQTRFTDDWIMWNRNFVCVLSRYVNTEKVSR